MKLKNIVYVLVLLLIIGCSKSDDNNNNTPPPPDNTPQPIAFDAAQSVTVSGYTDHIMEPFLSRDGSILFFNNLNDPSVNTNLHWAIRTSTTTFIYQGELNGINTDALEGVATMDNANNFFYVFTGDYENNLSTIYSGTYNDGTVSNIEVVENISRLEAGWLNFDVEVSANGNTLYFVDGRYDENGGPYEANIVIAERNGTTFSRAANSDEILANINTDNLEYAPGISADEKLLYFTRIDLPLGANPLAKIYIATRNSTSEPFGVPQLISELSGFVEAATVTPDGSGFYYHKKEDNLHVLYYRDILN